MKWPDSIRSFPVLRTDGLTSIAALWLIGSADQAWTCSHLRRERHQSLDARRAACSELWVVPTAPEKKPRGQGGARAALTLAILSTFMISLRKRRGHCTKANILNHCFILLFVQQQSSFIPLKADLEVFLSSF